jgi:hypothetical protein
VRIFGGLGAILLLLSGLIAAWALVTRVSGGLWAFPQLFGALVMAVAGVTLYTTGTSFSYIVKLFHKRPIRQGMFGPRGNGRRIERHYWWLGILAVLAGIVCYIVAAAVDLTAPGSAAPWFAPVVSAMLVLTGVQLVSAWGLARMLAELSQRASLAQQDLAGAEVASFAAMPEPTLAVSK